MSSNSSVCFTFLVVVLCWIYCYIGVCYYTIRVCSLQKQDFHKLKLCHIFLMESLFSGLPQTVLKNVNRWQQSTWSGYMLRRKEITINSFHVSKYSSIIIYSSRSRSTVSYRDTTKIHVTTKCLCIQNYLIQCLKHIIEGNEKNWSFDSKYDHFAFNATVYIIWISYSLIPKHPQFISNRINTVPCHSILCAVRYCIIQNYWCTLCVASTVDKNVESDGSTNDKIQIWVIMENSYNYRYMWHSCV